MSTWTLLRFFTTRTTFDLVSQQVIVHQWLQGAMTPAHMGQTAYVLKMLVLYVPLDLLPGSPRLKLIAITLAINIATFVLLGVVLERLLREFGGRVRSVLYAALVGLSAIAGSVFWIGFANSRNLEVVGGVLWMYLGLRYIWRQSWRLAISLVILGGLLFFDDPLQFYMTALPLLVYGVALAAAGQYSIRAAGKLLGLSLAAWGLAHLLAIAMGHWLQLSFTDTGGLASHSWSASWLVQSVAGVAKAVLSLFAGGADAGRARELANIGLLGLGLAALVYNAVKRLVPRRLIAFLACWVAVDLAVYAASGQAVHGAATSRYLIMLAPAALVGLGMMRWPRHPWSIKLAVTVMVAGLALNVGALGSSLLRHWDGSFPADAQQASVYRYAQAHPKLHVYTSIDTAMAVLYLHNLPAQRSLPVGCLDGKLVRTHYSMDRAFADSSRTPGAVAAIVLDGTSIQNSPNVCTTSSISSEFGAPIRLAHTDNSSVVLLYRQAALRLPD
ncbi:MAG TPA: hypothetical protein VLF69_05830 [Candidatus Saccharimonadales bacterium]|nr:hypothetical protein [Candidatus Saccharimonadales bacterium]